LLFCTSTFLTFCAGVLALYWLLPWRPARTYLLLAASFYFYSCWDIRLALLIACSSAADFFIGLALDNTERPRLRFALMLTSVVGNLGMLCVFKYAGFFLASLESAANAAGLGVSLPLLRLAAPIGISFYTFEALSYTVDVYRKRIRAERNLAHFMLFILFFPHLVAGPIVRGRDFLPQIRRRKLWNWERMQVAVEFIVLGLIKKMAIGDRMAPYADPVFADPSGFSTSACWAAVVAYSIQIYCDFSGYTDIAIGVAHLFGFRLTKNFDMPYLSCNVSEFWRRWHMSLSSWLRDYLFIPLGGSRGTTWLTCRNFLIVMILGGLWHGAAWTFVAWGLLHGLYLIAYHGYRAFCEGRPRLAALSASIPGRVAGWALTMACVMAAWVFFRAQTFAIAGGVLQRLVVHTRGAFPHVNTSPLFALLGVVVLGHIAGALRLRERLEARVPGFSFGTGYAAAAVLALVFAADASKAFIYFQF
jgi:alginate O-acetyltransferase complex protein AlgI